MVAQLNQTVRELALSGLRERHPQCRLKPKCGGVRDLVLGPELAEKAMVR